MRKYGKSGWFGESHRHYLASKGIMTSGAGIMLKSNMLGRHMDLKKSFESGESVTPYAAHEGSEVLPRAFAAGAQRIPGSEALGERYLEKSNRTAVEYAADKDDDSVYLEGSSKDDDSIYWAKKEYVIEGKYPGPHGWEEVTAEDSRDEALERLREYNNNEPGVAHRLRVKTVKEDTVRSGDDRANYVDEDDLFAKKYMAWKAEVIADDSGEWTGNNLKFNTKEEAEKYASDLASRWFAVRDTRVVEDVSKPANYSFDGSLKRNEQ